MWSKKELIDRQARFWVLMAAGSTLQAACDAVGVDRRTGRHWRQATGGRIPRKKPEPLGRYLSLEERLQIADLHLAETGVRAIARKIGRPASTISRELHRNEPDRARGPGASTRRMPRRSGPSCAPGGPRRVSLSTPSWRMWSKPSCV